MALGSFAFAAMVALAFGRWIADGFNAVFAKWRKLGFLGRIVAASFTVIATVEAQKEEGTGGRGTGNGGVGRGEIFNAERCAILTGGYAADMKMFFRLISAIGAFR